MGTINNIILVERTFLDTQEHEIRPILIVNKIFNLIYQNSNDLHNLFIYFQKV